MNRRTLKQLSARAAVHASVISDGCRDYCVEIHAPQGTRLLTDRKGAALRFRNLDDARALLRGCRVATAALRQRVAHDEACAGSSRGAPFSELPLSLAS